MISVALAAILSLGDAQSLALARAPSVVEARARVTEAEALVRVARGNGALHGILNYNQSPQAGATNTTVLQRLTTVGGQISLSDLAGRDPAVARAQASLRSAQASKIAVERAERIRVIHLYVEAQRAHAVRVLREMIEASSLAFARAVSVRYRNGDASRLDEGRSDIVHIQAEADTVAAKAGETDALAALAMEIGREPNAIALPTLEWREAPTGMPTIDGAVEFALAHRPEIALARADVTTEEAALRVAGKAGLPALTAQVGYTYGTDTEIPVHGPSANVTLDFPVSGVSAATAAAQSARVEQARARLTAVTWGLRLEVEAAYRALKTDVYEEFAAGAASAEAEKVVKATELGFNNGASSSLEVTQARLTYAQAAIAKLAGEATFDEALATWPLTLGNQGEAP
ncbi:MAG TPA: TolC family protein [Candidatus Baltobacteraceae bacterium]|nr:TolC family protein [Candidatus Baltobacteraceae bacterium]